MEITLNDKIYTAPAPLTGLWFAIQKSKTEQKKRVDEMTKILEEIKQFEGKKDIDDDAAHELEKKIIFLTQKTEDNKLTTMASKIKIIIDAFKNDNVTQETILEYVPLQDISIIYAQIELWLNDIMLGRTAQLPNVETPAE